MHGAVETQAVILLLHDNQWKQRGKIAMSFDEIVVIVFGLLGIIFTYWFFLGKAEREMDDHEHH